MKRKKNITTLMLLLIACKIAIVAFSLQGEGLLSSSPLSGLAYAQLEQDKNSSDDNNKANSFDINIEMMKALNQRKEALDKEEKKLSEKEKMLQMIEQGIQAKLDEMNKIKKEIEKLIVKRDELEEASLLHLVKIYKNMTPNEAASQLSKLDKEIAVQVFTRMKSRTSSKILPFLKPKFATTLSEEIVKRRLIQEPQKKKR